MQMSDSFVKTSSYLADSWTRLIWWIRKCHNDKTINRIIPSTNETFKDDTLGPFNNLRNVKYFEPLKSGELFSTFTNRSEIWRHMSERQRAGHQHPRYWSNRPWMPHISIQHDCIKRINWTNSLFRYLHMYLMFQVSGIILGMCSANERRSYSVTSSLIGWARDQNDLCIYPFGLRILRSHFDSEGPMCFNCRQCNSVQPTPNNHGLKSLTTTLFDWSIHHVACVSGCHHDDVVWCLIYTSIIWVICPAMVWFDAAYIRQLSGSFVPQFVWFDAAYIRQWAGSFVPQWLGICSTANVQSLPTKPLGTISSEMGLNLFHSRKCIWKYRLHMGSILFKPQTVSMIHDVAPSYR